MHKHGLKLSFLFLLIVYSLVSLDSQAQNERKRKSRKQVEVKDSYERDSRISRMEIAGIIKDTEGFPIPGATVMLQGTQTGTVSDKNGLFRLTLRYPPPVITLVCSLIGYTTTEYKIASERSIRNLTLEMKPEIFAHLRFTIQ